MPKPVESLIFLPLLLWALTSGQTAAISHRNIKVWAFIFFFVLLYQQFTHEVEQSVYQAFKTRTELTDVREKNITCVREPVKSRWLQIHQQQRKHHSSLICQPGMQLLNRLINMFVDGKCTHNLRRLLFLRISTDPFFFIGVIMKTEKCAVERWFAFNTIQVQLMGARAKDHKPKNQQSLVVGRNLLLPGLQQEHWVSLCVAIKH